MLYIVILDVNECVLDPCGESVNQCDNFDGAYSCTCAQGYVKINVKSFSETCNGELPIH